MGLAGLLFLFFGVRFFKPVLFVTGLGFGSILTYIAMLYIREQYEISGEPYVVLGAPLGAGCVFGLLFLWLAKLGIMAIGALAGFCLAVWIMSWKSGGLIPGPIYRPIFMTMLPLIGAVIGILLEKSVIIIGTAIVGAAAIASSIDIFYPMGFNQAIRYYLINRDSFRTTDSLMVLLGCYIGAVILGILIQYKIHASVSKERSHAIDRHYRYRK